MTDVPLREYIERVVAENEQRNLERIRTLEKQVSSLEVLIEAKQRALALAVEKQEAAYDARFANVNEFRASLNDAVNRSVTREYVDTRLNEADRRLNAIESRFANLDGRIVVWSTVASLVIGVIVSIVSARLGG